MKKINQIIGAVFILLVIVALTLSINRCSNQRKHDQDLIESKELQRKDSIHNQNAKQENDSAKHYFELSEKELRALEDAKNDPAFNDSAEQFERLQRAIVADRIRARFNKQADSARNTKRAVSPIPR